VSHEVEVSVSRIDPAFIILMLMAFITIFDSESRDLVQFPRHPLTMHDSAHPIVSSEPLV
jgi:hypothetical protein